MGMKWVCDITGKEVFLAPPYKVVRNDKGEVVKIKRKAMNAEGKLEVGEVDKLEYLKEKAYLARITVGDETLQLCLSREGLDKIMPQLSSAWSAFEQVLSK